MLETFVHLLSLAQNYQGQTLALGFGALSLAIFLSVKWKRLILLMILAAPFALFGFANLLVSHIWLVPLVAEMGELGTATVLSVSGTNMRYNNVPVTQSQVLLKTADSQLVETSFRSNDFNIVPKPTSGYVYPSPGQQFSVRYLKHRPQTFVIVSDDKSPYARSLRCTEAAARLGAINNRRSLSPDSDALKHAHADAVEAFAEMCTQDPHSAKAFKNQADAIRK